MSPQPSSARLRGESERGRPDEIADAAEPQGQPLPPDDDQAGDERMAMEVEIAQTYADEPLPAPARRGWRRTAGTVFLLTVVALIGLLIGFAGVMLL